ncbi:hypothetical protein [Ferruginibacter albus]|uniref:hypothetical protein n=1 Tax=Ferruginibacter albus TaxID=2875540 RepID=UPI001CC7625B|nr:hypothetical protein [Ferruginibacter albus]UAY52560.1 hypothetical protein K9M53_02440 [Ferruginibacter albus]
MKKENKKHSNSEEDKKFPLPIYDKSEDIYNQQKELPLDEQKNEDDRSLDEGLDIPGAELDDDNEKIGEEDEENNYYSLGGDDHNDLEEEKE